MSDHEREASAPSYEREPPEPAEGAPRHVAPHHEPQRGEAQGTEGGDEPGEAETSELLELVLAPKAARDRRIDGVLVGRVLSLAPLLVRFADAPEEGVAARAFCDPSALASGSLVALAFEEGRADRPLVLGKMASLEGPPGGVASVDVRADGERVELTAERELVLRCGEASLTLTREGKILLRGTYLSSRATGVHRIQGGTVEIN